MLQRQATAMGLRIDRYVFARGEGLSPHQHNEDHLTIVTSGKILARNQDREIERSPNDAPILFRSGREHSIEAIEDETTILNIFLE